MKLIAHRGNDSHSFKENTKEALLWCLKQDYIEGVELDIRLTKDKKFIIYHNTSFLELGIKRRFIKNETLETLKKINLGTIENPSYLSSLDNFLKDVNSNKMILLDVKNEIGDSKEVVDALRSVCITFSHLNIYLCSFCQNIVKLSTNMCKFPVGLLISDFINKNKDYSNVDFLSVSKGAFPDISSKKKKMVWTINKKSELKSAYKDMYIITDKAYKLVSE